MRGILRPRLPLCRTKESTEVLYSPLKVKVGNMSSTNQLHSSSTELVLNEVRDAVAWITLNRPAVRNAQNVQLLADLDRAWTVSAEDPEVRVIVLRGAGQTFSAGHDISSDGASMYYDVVGDTTSGAANRYFWEHTNYLGMSRRWRNILKPSIAAVQGKCVAAALALCWPCDLIVATEDAEFSDPTLLMGIPGIEYQGHAWEFGVRRAKELLFTARKFTAAEAMAFGMVNRVVPRENLDEAVEDLARRIAAMPPFAVALAKKALNQVQDIQGFSAALDASYDTHQLGHVHNQLAHGTSLVGGTIESMRVRTREAGS